MVTQRVDSKTTRSGLLRLSRLFSRRHEPAYIEFAVALTTRVEFRLTHPLLTDELKQATQVSRNSGTKASRNALAQLAMHTLSTDQLRDVLFWEEDMLRSKRRAAQARAQAAEAWRRRLISEGDKALRRFLELYPQANMSRIKTYIQHARRKPSDNRAVRAASELMEEIRRLSCPPPSESTACGILCQ